MNIGENFLVELSHSTVALLMSQRLHDAETVDQVIRRRITCGSERNRRITATPKAAHAHTPQTTQSIKTGIYTGEVLGREIASDTLASFFAEVIDTIHDVAPEAVANLAQMRARTRAYVARTPAAVHAGRTDLPTKKTSSGWYVSENIGQKDLVRALEALCRAAGLSYSRDIRFGYEN